MAKFCKKCGAALTEGMAFCEACGAPIQSVARVESAANQAEASPQNKPAVAGKKLLLGIGGGTFGLLLLGAGAWFLTSTDYPSASTLSDMLNADARFKSRTVCLDNFQYDHSPANINPNDQSSRQWFEMLAETGLYSGPQSVTTGGWFPRELLQFTPTDKGKQAIQNGRLCFAQGVALDEVKYGETQHVQKNSYVAADYTYHYLNAESWTQRPEAKELAAEAFAQDSRSGKLVLERTDKEWRISGIPPESLAALSEAQNTRIQSNTPNPAGFLDGLSKLFSGFGSNPLIGKWRNSISGEDIEFAATGIVGPLGTVHVNYEIKGKQVYVTNPDTQGVSICTLVDQDHMNMQEGGLIYKFRRITN